MKSENELDKVDRLDRKKMRHRRSYIEESLLIGLTYGDSH